MIRLKTGKGNQWLFFKSKDSFATAKNISPLEKIKKTSLRHHLKPMLPSPSKKAFDHKNWIFEMMWNGVRALAEVKHASVDLYSSSLKSLNTEFPSIVKELKMLKVNAVFDGEIIAVDKKGKTSSPDQLKKTSALYYYIFDLLYLDGRDLRKLPLLERKKLLEGLLQPAASSHIQYCGHVEEKGQKFFRLCSAKGIKGIMAKEKTSRYLAGKRSKQWLEIKTSKTAL